MKAAILSLLLVCSAFSQAPTLQKAEFTFKLRGYCHAYSAKVTGLGGHGRSSNMPKKVPSGLGLKPGLHMIVDATKIVPFAERFEGFTLRLVNSSSEAAEFVASDSRLDIVMQAQNSKGKWQDIEYLPQSWCGNSYHTLELPAGHMWEFAVPKYSGPMKTKLRMSFARSTDKRIYSESFDGAIDPKQFTIEQGNTPTNIMDPYTK